MFIAQLIIKLLVLFGWINNLYFGYRAIKYDYNFNHYLIKLITFLDNSNLSSIKLPPKS